MAAATLGSKLLLGGLLVAGCWSAILAQTVYRCGPQGNQYSQQPCPSGQAIDVGDARSADQLAQARMASTAQKRLALQMERERRNNERALRPPVAGGIDFRRASADAAAPVTKSRKPASKPRKGISSPPSIQREFVAIEPGSGKKKLNRTQD